MKALLLAAGLGTRLRPLTQTIPKCLVPINGKPLLAYWLEILSGSDISGILINLHYLPDQVAQFLRTSPYGDKVTPVYEDELLGTAGTLLENRRFFQRDRILLIHADNFSVFDLDLFIDAHHNRPGNCGMTMMTFETDAPETCGIVELDDQNVVIGFHEKTENPPGNLANGAVYILEPSILNFLENTGKRILDFSTDVLPHFVGNIYTFHNAVYHRDIGNMESYLKAQERL